MQDLSEAMSDSKTNNEEETNTVFRGITSELVGALINYLQQYPYNEVSYMINSLSSSPTIRAIRKPGPGNN
jgi:hypothetical protein